ncbi:MAG TPA: tetratricopeptide repeat protein [bacterium]|nr:tetratricopeptide repeat protein [bacterium]
MKLMAALAVAVALVMVSLATSCVGTPAPRPGTAMAVSSEVTVAQAERTDVESMIALGSPSSLEHAVQLAQDAKYLSAADAKAYGWVAYEMARLVYPELAGDLPPSPISPPDTPLVRSFIDARNGKAITPGSGSGPLFELFPALSIFRLKTSAATAATLLATERFSRFGLPSAAIKVAQGMALERSGDRSGALDAYAAGESMALDCYPATLGKARMLVELGRGSEALSALEALSGPIGDGLASRRIKAQALYAAGRWTEALPLITAVLLDDPLDSRFALMRAHLLVERGEYKQAAPLLDAYASINPNDRLYIVLRARYSIDGSKDRATATMVLRNGLQLYPDDQDITLLAAEVFSGGDTAERAQAIELANAALTKDPASTRALKVLLSADIAAGDFQSAALHADAILAARPDYADLESLYKAYRGASRFADASKVAQSWRARDPNSEPAALAWASMLIERGEKSAALDMVTKLLAGKGSASYRSMLYWLQSRLQTSEDAILASLRSALVENGMNIDALAAMSDIYVRKADYQRARFYLKQAISIAPDRPDIVERRNVLTQLGVAIP